MLLPCFYHPSVQHRSNVRNKLWIKTSFIARIALSFANNRDIVRYIWIYVYIYRCIKRDRVHIKPNVTLENKCPVRSRDLFFFKGMFTFTPSPGRPGHLLFNGNPKRAKSSSNLKIFLFRVSLDIDTVHRGTGQWKKTAIKIKRGVNYLPFS